MDYKVIEELKKTVKFDNTTVSDYWDMFERGMYTTIDEMHEDIAQLQDDVKGKRSALHPHLGWNKKWLTQFEVNVCFMLLQRGKSLADYKTMCDMRENKYMQKNWRHVAKHYMRLSSLDDRLPELSWSVTRPQFIKFIGKV